MSLRAESVFVAASESSPATLGASSLSGGMRMLWPSSIRSLLSARLPLTRNSPLRTTRWIWENDRPGKRASRKRSTRMLFSSAVTTTVWTLVGSGTGSGAIFSGSATNGAGLAGCRAAKRGGLPPGRCACGRSAGEPLYGRAPFGRSPRAFNGLLTRRLISVCGSKSSRLRSPKAAHRHGEISTNPARDRRWWAKPSTNHGSTGMALLRSAVAALAAILASAAGAEGPVPDDIAWKLLEPGAVVDMPRTAALYAPLQQKEPYPGVKVERDVKYGPADRNLLDVFTPQTASSPRPVVIFVHG